MIGPSTGATGSGGSDEVTTQDDPCSDEGLFQSTKRRAIEELDFDSICEEVCGHPHKRPRLLEADLLHGDPVFFGQTLQNCDEPFDVLAESCDHHHEHFHQVEADGTVTRLEVLVVDSTWNEALESLEAAEATVALQPFGELAPIVAHPQQPSSDLHSLTTYPESSSYWTQVDQNQEQEQSNQPHQTSMPKVTGNNDAGRLRFASTLTTAQPAAPSANSNYEDQENGNLSWLLDFKLDSFIEAHEDRSTVPLLGNKAKLNVTGNRTSYDQTSSRRNEYESTTPGPRYDSSVGGGGGGTTTSSPTSSCVNGYSSSGSGDTRNSRCGVGVPKKPPFTYTELIEHALQERGELTVSAIYQWISEHFPYYKSNDDRWKNSVRHNLSINPHFRKGSKAPHGAGHLWAIASQDEGKSRHFFNIATIRQALKNDEANASKNDSRHAITIDEVAAATASISQPEEEDETIVDTITLEHCAEQILSGIKKEVEVQYLVPMMSSNNNNNNNNNSSNNNNNGNNMSSNQTCNQSRQPEPLCPAEDTDFLNPVSKEIVAEECGLIGEGYLVTDLNPSSLGLNMTESEVVTTDNLFGEELSFQFYEFASPSQLQSA